MNKFGQKMVFTLEQWEKYRLTTDKLADEAINDVFATGTENPMRFLFDLDRLDEEGSTSFSDLPVSVQNLITARVPDWLSERIDVSQCTKVADRVFDDCMVEMVLSLLGKSLPECYAGWRGATVLSYTGKLGSHNYSALKSDSTLVRRVVETAQFVDHVMQSEFWTGDLPIAIRTITKIRLFHAGVRRMIARKGMPDGSRWDAENLGEPINQEDLVATLLAFSHQCVVGAKMLGAPISEDEVKSMIGHWAVVGFYLGIERQILEQFLDHPKGMWDEIEARQFTYTENHPGIALTQDLTLFMERHLFPSFFHAHVPAMIMDNLVSQKAAACVLKFPNSRARQNVFIRFIGFVLLMLHRIIDAIPVIGPAVMRFIGREIEQTAIRQWSAGRPARITLSDELRGT